MKKIILAIASLMMFSTVHAQNFSVRLDGGYKITPIADVTVTNSATLVHAADSSRVSLSCTNTDPAVNVRWGNSSVTATTGQRIPAGTSVEIRNTAAIYMISEGANVSMSCTKETY